MKSWIFLCLLVFMSLACSEEDEPYEDYQGTWSGSYSGADTGIWQVNVNDKGQVLGTATSDSLPQFSMDFNGSVNTAGKFSARVIVFQDTVVYTGQLKDNTASGTWSGRDSSFSGTWQGAKN